MAPPSERQAVLRWQSADPPAFALATFCPFIDFTQGTYSSVFQGKWPDQPKVSVAPQYSTPHPSFNQGLVEGKQSWGAEVPDLQQEHQVLQDLQQEHQLELPLTCFPRNLR